MATETTKPATPPEKTYAGWDDDSAPGYVKSGFLGFQGAGKTVTGTLFAIAVREHFKITEPIAFFDTETGSGYVAAMVELLTGKKPLIRKARSFDDLMAWGKKLVEQGLPIGLADSISHPWREMTDSYLKEQNEFRKRKGWDLKKSLEFADWNTLKPRWAKWTDFYLNSALHLTVCGRAGYEYDMEENEEKGKKELVKTGIKMKTEGEFGYEPSLLVQMVLDRKMVKNRQQGIRRAVVLKDRFMLLDGKEVEFVTTTDYKKALVAVRKFFEPHLDRYTVGAHTTVDTALKTSFGTDDEGDADWTREKREREILCDEIQGFLVQAFPGQTQADKQIKGKLLFQAFNTYAWADVESRKSDDLRAGLKVIVAAVRELRGDEAPPAPETKTTRGRKGKVQPAAAKELEKVLDCPHKNAPAPSTLAPGVAAICPDCNAVLEPEPPELALTAQDSKA
jgi:hypothetical protein